MNQELIFGYNCTDDFRPGSFFGNEIFVTHGVSFFNYDMLLIKSCSRYRPSGTPRSLRSVRDSLRCTG
jgi:hypothetical protein